MPTAQHKPAAPKVNVSKRVREEAVEEAKTVPSTAMKKRAVEKKPTQTSAGLSLPLWATMDRDRAKANVPPKALQPRPAVALAPHAPVPSPVDPIAEAEKALGEIAQWMRPIEILDEKKGRRFAYNSSVRSAIKLLRSTTVPVCLYCNRVNNHKTDDCRYFKSRQEQRAAQQAQPSISRPPTTAPPTPTPSLPLPSVAPPTAVSFPRLKPSIEAQGLGPEFEEALRNGELQLRMTNNPARGWPMYAHNTSPWDQPAKPLHPALLLEHPLDNCLYDNELEYDVSRFPLEAWLPPIPKEREDALCPPHLYTLKAPPEDRKYKWPT